MTQVIERSKDWPRARGHRFAMLLALGGVVALLAAAPAAATPPACNNVTRNGTTVTVTCPYTGGLQSFTVPSGVTSVTLDAKGGRGGWQWPSGGGGEESGTLAVSAGDLLTILVGQAGGAESGALPGGGGYGGGGSGGSGSGGGTGGAGGGGGSFVYEGTTLELVAGGGGGSSGFECTAGGQAADGGGGGGDTGQAGCNDGGGGGTQSGGGAGGTYGGSAGGGPATWASGAPQPGVGGDGSSGAGNGGGGGGGGYYGGGGGYSYTGGGGSGYMSPSITDGSQQTGVNGGDGVVTITYTTPSPTITSADATTFTQHSAGSFTVTASGADTLTLSETGALPDGVTFIDNGNGTATIAGTPTVGSGAYPITITASSDIPPDDTQSFTLYVSAPCPAANLSGGGWVVTCSYTGGPQTFTVPLDFSSITLKVDGAQGGADRSGTPGASGGEESGVFQVSAGDVLTVLAGGEGGAATGTTGGAGGYGGGGDGAGGTTDGGGGGGGGSYVFDADNLLAVAGGGGGAATGCGGGGGDAGVGRAGSGGDCTQGGGGATELDGGTAGTGATAGGGPVVWNLGTPAFGLGGGGGTDAFAGGGGGGGYYGGGGGGGAATSGSEGGGGGGSGWLPEFAGSQSSSVSTGTNGSVTITYTPAPPSAQVSSPASGGIYALDQSVPTTFSCSDSPGAPGIKTCKDSGGLDSPGKLDTSTPGARTYTVTATSKDGQTAQAKITYTVVPRRTLTITKAGSGSGTVTSSPAGIDCGSTCSKVYDARTLATLTATPAPGSTFAGWSGGTCSGSSTCTVSMVVDRDVTATFTASAPSGPGAGASSGGQRTSAPKCSLTHKSGTVLLARHRKGKHRRTSGTLKLKVRCDQAAKLVVRGKVTVQLAGKHRHGKRRTKAYRLRSVRRSLRAGRTATITLKMPARALARLLHHARESLSLTLSATNANGAWHGRARIKRLHARRAGRRRAKQALAPAAV